MILGAEGEPCAVIPESHACVIKGQNLAPFTQHRASEWCTVIGKFYLVCEAVDDIIDIEIGEKRC